MKDTTETVSQHNSSEAVQENFMTFVLMKDINGIHASVQEMLI